MAFESLGDVSSELAFKDMTTVQKEDGGLGHVPTGMYNYLVGNKKVRAVSTLHV